MAHLYYKVLIDDIEVAIFDSDNMAHLVNFINLTSKGCAKRIDIISGYYDGDNKWHDYEDIEIVTIILKDEDNEEGYC